MIRIPRHLLLLTLATPLLFACSDEQDRPQGETSIMKSQQIQTLKEAQSVSKEFNENLQTHEKRMEDIRKQ